MASNLPTTRNTRFLLHYQAPTYSVLPQWRLRFHECSLNRHTQLLQRIGSSNRRHSCVRRSTALCLSIASRRHTTTPWRPCITSRPPKNEWLTEYADFSNCFLMGTSAGGNIAYHAGLRVATAANDVGLKPLKIKGLILHHRFFCGLERTGSELRLADASLLTLPGCDGLWELSLPVDAYRDHAFCNPTVCDGSGLFGRVRSLGWRALVAGGIEDMLIDRQMEFAKMLEKKGICTVGQFGGVSIA
ncbi:hypothetical protein RJ639_027870 [Escallonia herrerae]|uniref:Alpha/beta hydrolase fold-3 domain-containing protein n=1 Tax=Escallonia herrerae TaxID=1293975 RepID=A0AA88X7S8_9ASTE|nr:hypothetical protein RJ639_027870 [Escallonia herrerae]